MLLLWPRPPRDSHVRGPCSVASWACDLVPIGLTGKRAVLAVLQCRGLRWLCSGTRRLVLLGGSGLRTCFARNGIARYRAMPYDTVRYRTVSYGIARYRAIPLRAKHVRSPEPPRRTRRRVPEHSQRRPRHCSTASTARLPVRPIGTRSHAHEATLHGPRTCESLGGRGHSNSKACVT